jgi:predicted permease
MIFWTTLQQVAILLIIILTGYFLRRKGIIDEHVKVVLASLLVNLFSPAYTIMSLSTIINVHEIKKYAVLFVAGTAFAIVSVFLAIPFAKMMGKDRFHKNIYKYAFAFGNVGYFGYPLINAVFGAVARAQMILFCVPLNIVIASYGYYVLTERPNLDGSLLEQKIPLINRIKRLFSVPLIASLIGILIGLISSGFNFTLPKVFVDLFTTVGECQSAPAMILTGAVLASVPISKLFTSIKAYVIGAIRLLLIPMIFSGLMAIIYLLGWQDANFMRTAFFVIISSAMPVGMNVVVYPESVGLDSTEGAKSCFVSYILSLITLPLICMILMNVITVIF